MEIKVDGKPVAGQLAGDNLQDILNDLSEKVLGPDLALRELLINGRPYTMQEHGPAMAVPVQSIRTLEIETVNAKEVAMLFLATSGSTLTTMATASEKVAELFRMDDERQANEQYLQFLESLDLLLTMLQRCQDALVLDFTRPGEDGVSPAERLKRLTELTDEMLEAQEGKDWLLLADIMQHDLAGEFLAWKDLLAAYGQEQRS